jgi:hypothetical protein
MPVRFNAAGLETSRDQYIPRRFEGFAEAAKDPVFPCSPTKGSRRVIMSSDYEARESAKDLFSAGFRPIRRFISWTRFCSVVTAKHFKQDYKESAQAPG